VEYLAAQDEFVVMAAGDTDQALAQVRREDVELVLLDMTISASTAAVGELAAAAVQPLIVGLGLGASEQRILTALEAGMAGYVAREDGLGALSRVIATVISGGVACSPLIAARLVRRVRMLNSASAEPQVGGTLTRREHEILELIEDGLSNKEIAARLDIELATVKNHVHRILGKLGVHRRTQAAAVVRGRIGDSPRARGPRM
jgi:two-component system, NarL family, nitrate/nitrite response regulator NarL